MLATTDLDDPQGHVLPTARSVERLLSADSAAALERFADSPLLAQGKISLIGLDAIVDRLGERWPARRTQVYEHVERNFERQLSGTGYWQRVSERDYLIVQPAATRYAAQAFCLSCLRELLKFFLGEARECDLRVCEVTRLSPTSLGGALLDPVHVEAAAAREAPPAALPETEVPFTQRANWSPFVTTDGHSVRVSCALEPVIELKNHARIGYRLARRVLRVETETELSEPERQRLSRADIERIDLATIARGIGRLASEEGAQLPSLIIPVSFITLSSLKSRALLVAAFKEAQTHVQRGLICEIVDIEGVPPSVLLAAISMIRPFCLFVVGHLRDPCDAATRDLKGAGLQGLSFDCAPNLDGDAQFLGWARSAITVSKRVTRSVMIYRLSGPRQAALADALGATHASLVAGPRLH